MKKLRNEDFIDGLLKAQRMSPATDKTISDDFVYGSAYRMFITVNEFVNNLLTFALYELAFNNGIQAKLIEEIDRIVPRDSMTDFTYDRMSHLKYMKLVMMETQRMYPAIGVKTKVCVRPFKFPETNVTVPRHCVVIIPVLGIHRDSEYYAEPEVFKPERFLVPSTNTDRSTYYFPFGDSQENTIGMYHVIYIHM